MLRFLNARDTGVESRVFHRRAEASSEGKHTGRGRAAGARQRRTDGGRQETKKVILTSERAAILPQRDEKRTATRR